MRPDDWPERLERHIDLWSAKRFSWGTNDCLQFASDWRGVVTGESPAAQWVRAYDGPVAAHRIMRRHGCRGLFEFCDFLFGARLASPLMAARGDIVSAQGSLGICLGERGVFLAQHVGLVALPARAFADAWRV